MKHSTDQKTISGKHHQSIQSGAKRNRKDGGTQLVKYCFQALTRKNKERSMTTMSKNSYNQVTKPQTQPRKTLSTLENLLNEVKVEISLNL